MSNIVPINGEQPEQPEEQPIIILDDVYRSAFLGHSISPLEPPRAVYSLPLLSIIEGKRLVKKEEEAQQSVLAMMRQIYKEHGNRSPHFVDDSIRREPKKEKNRIIRPGGR